MIDTLWQDVGYALRGLRRAPGFTFTAVLTLALGVGANTAIFSVVNAVLLKPLPYKDSDRLVRLMRNIPAAESPTHAPLRLPVALSAAEMAQVRSRTRALSDVGTAGPVLMGLSGYEGAARLQGARVSSAVFPMIGATPIIGRAFTEGDEAPGAEAVVLLSFDAWQRYFSGDRDIIGRALTFDSVLGPRRQARHVVIGVMPQGFEFPYHQTQFWVPLPLAASGGGAAVRGPLLGLLADGVSLQAAASELEPIVREIRRDVPAIRYELVREQDELVAPVRPALLVLTMAVGFVLLIACVNVASLLLARTAARQRELAIRTALGARRRRLVGHLLTESLILALLGGAVGAGLAVGGVQLFQRLATTVSRMDLDTGLAFPRLNEVGIDSSVLGFTLVTSLASGLLFGLAPAFRRSGSHPIDDLKGSAGLNAPAIGRSLRLDLRSVLVVAEISMAMVLLVGGGLLIHSFARLSNVAPGYDPANVLTFQVSLPVDRYPDTRLRTFAEDLVARLRLVPGVRAAAYANQLPLVNLTDTAGGLWPTPDPMRAPLPTGQDARFVSQEYLDVMGIRVIAGRGFGDTDAAGQPRALLVNQALADRSLPGESPVGRLAYIGRDPSPWEIVGIVENVRQRGLDRAPDPQFFVDLRQWSGNGPLFPVGAYYAIRIDGDDTGVTSTVRNIVRDLDPQAALFNVASMEELVVTAISRPRMYAVLLGIFAAVGVVLAALGVYGVMAYSVTQRTREIGVRMALGARRSQVMGLVLRQSMALTALGIALGLAGAAAVTQYLEGLLFGLTPLDPMTFIVVSVIFASVATFASYLPARRATRINPMTALRTE
jgi:predicted permease